MAASYRLVPADGPHASSFATTSIGSTSAPSAPVHDALRFGGPRNLVAEAHAASAHPLQHRLEAWSDTQEAFKLRTLGDLYGIHAPLRRVMEKRIVGKTTGLHSFLSPHTTSDLQLSILNGTDETLTHADVLIAGREQRATLTSGPAGETDLHAVMERQLGL